MITIVLKPILERKRYERLKKNCLSFAFIIDEKQKYHGENPDCPHCTFILNRSLWDELKN